MREGLLGQSCIDGRFFVFINGMNDNLARFFFFFLNQTPLHLYCRVCDHYGDKKNKAHDFFNQKTEFLICLFTQNS